MRKRRLIAVGALALAGMLSVAHGAWIPAKAKLAQVLLEDAWQKNPADPTAYKAVALGRYLARRKANRTDPSEILRGA